MEGIVKRGIVLKLIFVHLLGNIHINPYPANVENRASS
jgi:hypothetical protein